MRKSTAVVVLAALLQATVPVAAQAPTDASTPKQQEQQPSYDLRISTEKLAFRVYVNDLLIQAFPTRRIGSMSMPLNPAILRSGPQKLTIRLLPAAGQDRLPDTDDLKVELVVRSKTAPPRHTMLYELPLLRDGRQAQFTDPQGFSQTVQFEAHVPYRLAGWERSVPLDAGDPKLEAEVVEAYRRLIDDIGNRKGEAHGRAGQGPAAALPDHLPVGQGGARAGCRMGELHRQGHRNRRAARAPRARDPRRRQAGAAQAHRPGQRRRRRGAHRIQAGPQPRTIVYDIYLHRPAPGAKLEPIWYFMTDFN